MPNEIVSSDPMDEVSHRDATGTALVYVTTILLLVAIFLVQKAMQDKFDAGMFGGGGGVTAR